MNRRHLDEIEFAPFCIIGFCVLFIVWLTIKVYGG